MALLALIEQDSMHSNAFSRFNVAPRDRHDDFADQTDDVGIGATRYSSRRGNAARHLCIYCRQPVVVRT
ncbi:hypothetical protein XH99_20685 [Bradyrhizobium nanningense]|uniref:Uncharacterized protein n=1 Tax=Bradyrhizobium nanningense TaxID=1325118 RepID=A0A4V1L1U8_9BRAD|nr:hypothetical protein XH99_20685 [Bradyrhizobium nanningense]RXH29588.1 hypothetical protein XH84_21495 [Bradyrhizobium nanningense]TQF29120.1 hypothetical protein UNPA324_05320 [Bradyrhizobium sp. UNPA324]